ncbi:hypothetical protein L3Q82_013782, partial [Scortum barcoo]
GGWSLWLPWSPCSVTCGGGGVRKRERQCSVPPECRSACSGPSEEREACPALSTCPVCLSVHGGWSEWAGWSQCSGPCISDQRGGVVVPTRVRYHACTSPAPSNDTVPPGNSCPGDRLEVQDCNELFNCPVDGNWGAWSLPGPCSVSCGEGLQLSIRSCDSPAPKYGGKFCEGSSTRTHVCQNLCPANRFWSGWSRWGPCSSSCIPGGQVPVRTRTRTCSAPLPVPKLFSAPIGGCPGDGKQTERCNHLPHCTVDGAWGAWSQFSSCSVTCGVGLQVSTRRCDSPTPKHGGQPCPGEGRRTMTCQIHTHCPALSGWGVVGVVTVAAVQGTVEGWEQWSLCKPACGGQSRRIRKRICKPIFEGYSPTIGLQREIATFFGDPKADCKFPDGEQKYQVEDCVNVPDCP